MPSAKRSGPDFGARVQRAVIPFNAPQAEPLAGALTVPIEHIQADPEQPRRDWSGPENEARLAELAASIAEFGIMQPLVVSEYEDEMGRTRYRVIAGGRRLAAARLAGVPRVPVLVRSAEGTRLRILQLTENVQRQSLHPLDEARTFQELIDLEGLTPRTLAERLHISDQSVRNRLRLLTNQPLADAMVRGQLSATAANLALQLPDAGQRAIAARLEAGEEITTTEVQRLRAQLEAQGVENPRRTPRADRKRAAATTAGQADARSPMPLATPAGAPEDSQAAALVLAQAMAPEDEQPFMPGSQAATTDPVELAMPGDDQAATPGSAQQDAALHSAGQSAPSDLDAAPAAAAIAAAAIAAGSAPAEEGQNGFDPDARAASGEPAEAHGPARRHRPTYIRLLEIERTLANLTLVDAADPEEARAWLAVLRQVASRATTLRDALERLHGDGLLPPQEDVLVATAHHAQDHA